MKDEYYAHSLDGKPPEDWQSLEEHLKNVAEKARAFAEAFGADGLSISAQKKALISRDHWLSKGGCEPEADMHLQGGSQKM